jgi:hypothetical protein
MELSALQLFVTAVCFTNVYVYRVTELELTVSSKLLGCSDVTLHQHFVQNNPKIKLRLIQLSSSKCCGRVALASEPEAMVCRRS